MVTDDIVVAATASSGEGPPPKVQRTSNRVATPASKKMLPPLPVSNLIPSNTTSDNARGLVSIPQEGPETLDKPPVVKESAMSHNSDPDIYIRKPYTFTNQGIEVTVYLELTLPNAKEPDSFSLSILPMLEHDDVMYNSVHHYPFGERLNGVVFASLVLEGDQPEEIMVLYDTLEEFIILRRLAAHQTALTPENITIQGRIPYGTGALPYGRVDYAQAPYSTVSNILEPIILLPLVADLTSPGQDPQCCLSLSILTFQDFTMHVADAVLASTARDVDPLSNPGKTKTTTISVSAVADYRSWHAQCLQMGKLTSPNVDGPSSPPTADQGTSVKRVAMSRDRSSTYRKPVESRARLHDHPQEEEHLNHATGICQTDEHGTTVVTARGPRLSPVQAIYSPLASHRALSQTSSHKALSQPSPGLSSRGQHSKEQGRPQLR